MTHILFPIFFSEMLQMWRLWHVQRIGETTEKTHFAHKKGLLSCRICSKQFEEKNHLNEHEDIHVVNGKHYKCLEKPKMVWNVDLFIHIKEAYMHMWKTNMEKLWQNQSTKEKMIKTLPGKAWKFTMQE